METNREGHSEKIRQLDYKALVLNVYPNAVHNIIRDGDYIIHEVYTQDENDDMVCDVTCSYTLGYAWQRTWEKIEERMMRKLSQ